MSDIIMTPGQRIIRDEARKFTREHVSRQLILDMDAEKISYPREYIQGLAAQRLLGCVSPRNLGGAAWIGHMKSWR